MKASETDILRLRLSNQQIAQTRFSNPGDIVAWMGAMQAQNFSDAKWAIALRTPNATEADVEKAIERREIIRTWSLRGTLHFTTPADIRWMGSLVGKRLLSLYAGNFRRLELDEKLLKKTSAIIAGLLEGNKQVTRDEIKQAFIKKKIPVHDLRFSFILLRATLEGLICFGPRKNKELTHVLVEEWVAPANPRDADEALGELAERYFTSHGPATMADFSWWSGLTLFNTKKAISIVEKSLQKISVNNQEYWMGKKTGNDQPGERRIYLLPAFDEYLVSYADRSLPLDPAFSKKVLTPNGIFNPVLLMNRKVVATWKRIPDKKQVVVKITPFTSLPASGYPAIRSSVRLYGKYLDLPVITSLH